MRLYRSGRHTSRFVLAALIGASVLGMAACGRPAATGSADGLPPAAASTATGPPTPSTPLIASRAAHAPPAAGSSSPRGWRHCVNPYENYSVRYPGNWYTTQIRPQEVCAQFHPSRFTIPLESEYPLTALNVKRVPAPPSRSDTEFVRTLAWEQTKVTGRPAVRFETVSTGAGLDQAGTRQYGYVISLGRGLISVHTTAEPGVTRYAAWKVVVDKAARSLAVAKPAKPAKPVKPAKSECAPVRPGTGFYEAGRVATADLTTPVSRCTTISVSHIVDRANPEDRCQTFRVGFWPLVAGSLTYTEPVTACGGSRTVLARDVPDNTRYVVLYDIDYIDPEIQQVNFKLWQ